MKTLRILFAILSLLYPSLSPAQILITSKSASGGTISRAQAWVSTINYGGGTYNSLSVALGSNLTNPSTVVMCLNQYVGTAVTPTPKNTLTWTQRGTATTSNNTQGICWTAPNTGTGSYTCEVDFSPTATATYGAISCGEYVETGGVAPSYDTNTTYTSTACASTCITGNITTASGNDALISMFYNSTNDVMTPGSGYTQRDSWSDNQVIIMDQILSGGSTTQNASVAVAGTPIVVANLVALKP